MDSDSDDPPNRAGFPHSDIPGSKLVCQLPEAFRRLPRPSSPVAAKASTICAWSLDHITPNNFPPAPEVSQESGVMCWSRIQHTLGRGVRTAIPRPASLRLSELLKNPDVSSALMFGYDMRRCWWSQPESNRRPPACKAGALPAELWPPDWLSTMRRLAATARASVPFGNACGAPFSYRTIGTSYVVGLGRFELPTSPLSGVRSNRLSYRPATGKPEKSGTGEVRQVVWALARKRTSEDMIRR